MQLRQVLSYLALFYSLPMVVGAQKASTTSAVTNGNEVVNIRIPVVATDKKDHPVTDLTAADFHVFSEGKPCALASFATLSRSQGTDAARKTQPPTSQRVTIFYFDDRHLSMAQTKQAKLVALQALDGALEQDGYASIVTGTGSVSSPMTRNRESLRKAISTVQVTPFAASGESSWNFAMPDTYGSLADSVLRLQKLPGSRLLVVFSPGFSPVFPDIAEIQQAQAVFLELAAQAEVTVNALSMLDLDAPRRQEANAGLRQIAHATGGMLMEMPDAPLERFHDLAEPPEFVYVLEIAPTGKADGTTRRLKLTSSRPGVRLQYRESYLAPKRGR